MILTLPNLYSRFGKKNARVGRPHKIIVKILINTLAYLLRCTRLYYSIVEYQ